MKFNAEYDSSKKCLMVESETALNGYRTIPDVVIKADGGTSDGSHTFEELYFHRMMLFSIVCNAQPEKAWKSRLHEDGTMFPDFFIVGINTPRGQFSYHYHINHWDDFVVPELPNAPKWDGHVADDIDRLQSLEGQPRRKFYFTFGLGGPNKNVYQVIEAHSSMEARQCMVKWYSDKWAFMYTESEFNDGAYFGNLKALPTIIAYAE